jgi:hypothetical protein
MGAKINFSNKLKSHHRPILPDFFTSVLYLSIQSSLPKKYIIGFEFGFNRAKKMFKDQIEKKNTI